MKSEVKNTIARSKIHIHHEDEEKTNEERHDETDGFECFIELRSTGPYPGFFLGGPIEHRRCENRGAEGTERGGCGEVSPSPLKKFCILNMKMIHFCAFLVKLE
jgi:hypothetical protein